MSEQSITLKRCASCERWDGLRTPSARRDAVLLDSDTCSGVCRGGPWDGEARKARSACGRWTLWPALSADASDTP
ncbi:MAG: hypothetical protein L6Q60_09880 [Rhodocyclaceae bacterium]|nr:hypothetical protein [Rhodocyclaceae bacterium]